jgi:GT2 family glycosyltransferase
VIIPHAGGLEILRECLGSLAATSGVELEIVIVDNGSGETPSEWGIESFPSAHVLRYECKLGFAAACNRGVEAASGEFMFLFNNDAIVEPSAILQLAELLASDPTICAVQPKILWYDNPRYFDYSSAAGGLIDLYGIPFARGRVFETVEEDAGQYDDLAEVFWGAGAALMIRRDLYLQAGGLEEPFFAHMEEIDLLWRLQLMGYRILVLPQAVVRHRGAVTIKSGSFLKLYLNHRNSLAMLVRNYSISSLARYLPLRLGMDIAFGLKSLLRLDFLRFWAVTRAGLWILFSLGYLIEGRRRVQALRQVPERIILNRMYPGSVAKQYFLRRRRTWQQIEKSAQRRR